MDVARPRSAPPAPDPAGHAAPGPGGTDFLRLTRSARGAWTAHGRSGAGPAAATVPLRAHEPLRPPPACAVHRLRPRSHRPARARLLREREPPARDPGPRAPA